MRELEKMGCKIFIFGKERKTEGRVYGNYFFLENEREIQVYFWCKGNQN